MDEDALLEWLLEMAASPVVEQLAALDLLSDENLEQADLLMSDGAREQAGHGEDPARGLTVCETCGPLDSEGAFLAPVYHPAEVAGFLRR